MKDNILIDKPVGMADDEENFLYLAHASVRWKNSAHDGDERDFSACVTAELNCMFLL
jgi:hypothetical protein